MDNHERWKALEAYKELYWDEYKKSIKPDTPEWELYHHPKNANAIGLTIICTPIFYLFAGGGFVHNIIWTIGLWVFCGIYCALWNFCLDNDADNLYKRDIAFMIWLQHEKGICL